MMKKILLCAVLTAGVASVTASTEEEMPSFKDALAKPTNDCPYPEGYLLTSEDIVYWNSLKPVHIRISVCAGVVQRNNEGQIGVTFTVSDGGTTERRCTVWHPWFSLKPGPVRDEFKLEQYLRSMIAYCGAKRVGAVVDAVSVSKAKNRSGR